jgi:VanZ family protein
MDAKMCALYHVLVLFVFSVGVLSFRRVSMIILLFMIPVLGEIVQIFMPGRTPDFADALHGYLGILAGWCFVQMWREIKPVIRQAQLDLKKKAPERH